MSRSACAAVLLIGALISAAYAEIHVSQETFTSTAAPTKNFSNSVALIVQSPTATGTMANPSEAAGGWPTQAPPLA